MVTIIGLTGKAGSGKSTIAEYLEKRHGYVRLSLTEPLKNMLRALGLSDNMLYGEDKEVTSELLCGKSARHAMQTLGTEWGRNLIGEDIWINCLERKIGFLIGIGKDKFVIDDVRFLNEANWIGTRDNYGHLLLPLYYEAMLVTVLRNNMSNEDSHISEIEMDKIVPDQIICNDGTEESLYKKVDEVIDFFGKGEIR